MVYTSSVPSRVPTYRSPSPAIVTQGLTSPLALGRGVEGAPAYELGLRFAGSRFGGQRLGMRDIGLWCGVDSLWFMVYGLEFGVWCVGLGVKGLGFGG